MPIPWLAALKVIPWGSLLTGAPALAKAADTLLLGARARRAELASASDLQQLADRVAVLEGHDRTHAELFKQITDQVAALTVATEVVAARQRWLALGNVAALAISVIALVFAIAIR